jgi:hypothetical protein
MFAEWACCSWDAVRTLSTLDLASHPSHLTIV